MQKALILTVAMSMSPLMVLANSKQIVATPEVVEAMPENISAPQQVYVVQNASATQAAPQQVIRTQPVTVVEDTPLRESKAEALRRNRIEVEQETETRIVEKLESERMKAEKERADKIMQSLEGKKEEPAPVVVVPAPTPVPVQSNPFQYPPLMQPVQATPVQQEIVSEPAPIITSDIFKEEIKSEDTTEQPRFYIGGQGGFADYPGYKNIQGKYAAGFNAGMQFPERLIIEGSLIFSRYDLELVPTGYSNYYSAYNITEFMAIKQTNITGAVKYRILESRISPVVGLLAGYTRRDYSMSQTNNTYYSNSLQQNDITSHAFDMGISGGLTADLSKSFSLEFDIKYMFNLSYDVDSSYRSSLVYNQNNGRKSPEELDYILIGLGGKLSF